MYAQSFLPLKQHYIHTIQQQIFRLSKFQLIKIQYIISTIQMGKKNQSNFKSQQKNHSHKQKSNKAAPIHKNKPQSFKNNTPKMSAKNLFTIVPENEQEDQFAALGYDEEVEDVELKNQVEEQLEGEEQQFEQGEQNNQENEQNQGDFQMNQDEQNDEQFDEGIEDQQGDFNDQQNQFEGQQQEDQGAEQQDPDCDAPPLQGQDKQPVDASVVSLQIQQTVNILLNMNKLGDGKPRKYYIDRFRELLHQYYGYNFDLIDHFLGFFNPAELVQLFEANQTQRPLTIRTNTLKTRRKQLAQNLIQRGVNLDPLAEWSKVGIKIYESRVPIGATPEYLAGHYMLQSASSFLPVLALDPQPGQRVLDMSAAPGGKTTYIAQLMKNTGCVFANDLKKERLRALQYNLYRLGVTNTVVTCRDGRKYPNIFPNSFDRVLLDAPCTGLGIIAKDPSIKANRLLLDIYKNSHIQKELLTAAIDCTKVGGIIIYSTCSISPLENEQVVNYSLKKRFVKVVDMEIEVGQEGLIKFMEKRYHNDLKKTRRIYPHVHNMDGFYVAKLMKVAKGKRKQETTEIEEDKS